MTPFPPEIGTKCPKWHVVTSVIIIFNLLLIVINGVIIQYLHELDEHLKTSPLFIKTYRLIEWNYLICIHSVPIMTHIQLKYGQLNIHMPIYKS